MLPAGGRNLGGGARGSISIDVSGAQSAATSMKEIGRQIESSMTPAARAIAEIDRQLGELGRAGNAGLASRAIAEIDRQLDELQAASRRPIGANLAAGIGPAQQQLDQFVERFRRGESVVTRFGNTMRGAGRAIEQGLLQAQTATSRFFQGLNTLRNNIFSVVVAFGSIALAARTAFRSLEAGAQLELTEQRFDRLARSIDSTGLALSTDLQRATSGMISNAQSMALATDLIALGLARTHDEAVRLARVVTELDADMGELTLAIANQTTRRFDQLGISLEGFDERLQRAKETMSDERAFSMAFLEQAEAQIDRVGGISETTAGDVRRLEADWAQLGETFNRSVAEGLGPFLALLTGRAGQAIREQADEAAVAAENIDDLTDSFRIFRAEVRELQRQDPVGFEIFARDDLNAATVSFLRALADMTDSAQEFEREGQRIFGTEGFSAAIISTGADSVEAFLEMTDAALAAAAADEVLIQTHERLGFAIEQVTKSTEEFIQLLTTEHDTQLFERELEKIDEFQAGLDELNRMSRGEIPDPLAGIGGEERDPRSLAPGFFTGDQTEAITEWAQEVQRIEDQANADRLAATQQFESQRVEANAQFQAAMAEEEATFQRERLRDTQRLEADIQRIRDERARQETEWYAELQKDIAKEREQAAEDLIKLEEEHNKRIAEINRRFDADIREAAGRLDIDAVQRLQQEKKEALEQEEDDYEESRQAIEDRLQEFIQRETEAYEERIRLAREADERRIQEMRDALAEQHRIEDEDRAIRLEKMRASHEAQLAAIDAQETARLAQINRQALEETTAYEDAFLERLASLGLYHADWLEKQKEQQEAAIALFEEWWGDVQDTLAQEEQGAAGRRGPEGRDDRLPFQSPQTIGGLDPLVLVPPPPIAPSTTTETRTVNISPGAIAPGAIVVNALPGQSPEEIAGAVVDGIDLLFAALEPV